MNIGEFMKQKIIIQKLKSKARKFAYLNSLSCKSANEIASEIKTGSDGFLRSTSWKELRAKALELYGAKCMCCGYTSNNTKKIHVDHIKPRKYFPELALDFDNLQVLCAICNKEKGNKHTTDYRQGANK